MTSCRTVRSSATAPPPADPSDDDAAQARSLAFRTYVEPEIDVLLRVARTLTVSWAEAEDLTQECLIRAWSAADRFDGAFPRAWLLTILRRTHLNMCRRTRPVTVGDVRVLTGARPAFGAVAPETPEELLLAGILPELLDRVLRELDDRFRRVLELVDLGGLTCAEAAAVLDVPVGTVVSRLSRARSRVRARLAEDDGGGAEVSARRTRRVAGVLARDSGRPPLPGRGAPA